MNNIRNIDTYEILSVLTDWYETYFMDDPPKFHRREYFELKSQSQDLDTPTYIEVLSGEHAEEYYKAVYYEFKSLIIRDT